MTAAAHTLEPRWRSRFRTARGRLRELLQTIDPHEPPPPAVNVEWTDYAGENGQVEAFCGSKLPEPVEIWLVRSSWEQCGGTIEAAAMSGNGWLLDTLTHELVHHADTRLGELAAGLDRAGRHRVAHRYAFARVNDLAIARLIAADVLTMEAVPRKDAGRLAAPKPRAAAPPPEPEPEPGPSGFWPEGPDALHTFAGMRLRDVFVVADAHPHGFDLAAPPPIGEARGWPGGSVVWTVLAVVGPLAWCCGSHGRRAAIPCACLAAMAAQAAPVAACGVS